MAKNIIGLVGFKGSGKDTVGYMLQELADYTPMSFAQCLKDALCVLCDWDPPMLSGISPQSREWRERPDPYWSDCLGVTVTPRSLMQQFGTEIVRKHLHDEFWIMRLRKHIMRHSGNVVVTDCRFINEMAMITQMGGKLIWVQRPPMPPHYDQARWYTRQNKLTQALAWPFVTHLRRTHRSEWEWLGSSVDHVLTNNGSLQDLRQDVKKLLENLH
jgi:hypothetical protein